MFRYSVAIRPPSSRAFMRSCFTALCLCVAFVQAQAVPAEETVPFGEVGVVGYEPLPTDAVGGTLVLVATTPGGQGARVNLTGPDGIRTDGELETDGETVLTELLPGLYSLAATATGMQLAEGKLEVRSGERGFVDIRLVPIPDFDYDLSDYPPYGEVQVGAYEALEEADGTGSLVITTNLPDEAELNVTGSNGYRRDFIGNVILEDLTLSDLSPGPYSVAATAEGYALTEGKVEVRPGERIAVHLVLVELEGVTDTE